MKIINVNGVDYTLQELDGLLPDELLGWIIRHKPTDKPTRTRLGDTIVHIKPDLLGDTHYILEEVCHDNKY